MKTHSAFPLFLAAGVLLCTSYTCQYSTAVLGAVTCQACVPQVYVVYVLPCGHACPHLDCVCSRLFRAFATLWCLCKCVAMIQREVKKMLYHAVLAVLRLDVQLHYLCTAYDGCLLHALCSYATRDKLAKCSATHFALYLRRDKQPSAQFSHASKVGCQRHFRNLFACCATIVASAVCECFLCMMRLAISSPITEVSVDGSHSGALGTFLRLGQQTSSGLGTLSCCVLCSPSHGFGLKYGLEGRET